MQFTVVFDATGLSAMLEFADTDDERTGCVEAARTIAFSELLPYAASMPSFFRAVVSNYETASFLTWYTRLGLDETYIFFIT
jgi:hypothetical protein